MMVKIVVKRSEEEKPNISQRLQMNRGTKNGKVARDGREFRNGQGERRFWVTRYNRIARRW